MLHANQSPKDHIAEIKAGKIKSEFASVTDRINLYTAKKKALAEIALKNGDNELNIKIESLSMDKPNILWNLMDTTLDNEILLLEIANSSY